MSSLVNSASARPLNRPSHPVSPSRPVPRNGTPVSAPPSGGTSTPAGGQSVTVVVGGNPSRTLDGVAVRDGIIHDNPGPIMDQDYWRDSSGRIHDAWDHTAGDPDISRAGCGSTTAAVLLARYGQFSSEAAIDDHLRLPGQLGGSLHGLVDYYRMRGLAAQMYNGGSWGDLQNALRQGLGVQITLTHSGGPHTMSVSGMFTGEDGKEYIQLMDVGGRGTRVMAKEEFLRQWGEVQLLGQGGLRTGITNTYTLVGPPGSDLPSGGSAWGDLNAASSLAVLDGANDVANAFRYFGEGEIAGGCARLVDGLTQCIIQAPAAIVQYAGAGMEWLGNKAVDWAMAKINDPNESIWTKILAGLSLVFTFPFKMLGTGLRHLGQLVGGITAQLARLVSWPFSKLADWLHKDNDAANSVRYADPNGTSREQEHWRRLRETPVEPGKTHLINAMLSGNTDAEERRMILRVLESCCAPDGTVDAAQLQQLINAIGAERLTDLLNGTPEQARWDGLRAQATPSVSNPQPVRSRNLPPRRRSTGGRRAPVRPSVSAPSPLAPRNSGVSLRRSRAS